MEVTMIQDFGREKTMTKKEAIELLKLTNNPLKNRIEVDATSFYRAVDKAIEALEQESGKWSTLCANGYEPVTGSTYLVQDDKGHITTVLYDGSDWKMDAENEEK